MDCQLTPLLYLAGIMTENVLFFMDLPICQHTMEVFWGIEPISLPLIYTLYIHHSPKGPNNC